MGNSNVASKKIVQNNSQNSEKSDLLVGLLPNQSDAKLNVLNCRSNESKSDTDCDKKEIDNLFDVLNDLVHNIFLDANKYGYFSIYSPAHQYVQCDACNKINFVVDRYKCLVCEDYDLCGECFESRKISLPHVKGHPMVRYSGPKEIFGEEIEAENVTLDSFKNKFYGVEHEVTCDGCNTHPIFGLRFKCDECINFDLCYKCFTKKIDIGNHKVEHSLLLSYSIRNVNPSDIELLECLGSGAFGTAYKAKLISKNKIVVCKIVEWHPLHMILGLDVNSLYQSFIREVLAYNEINSNFVIKAYGSCVVNNQSIEKFYLLTEYMEKGCLTKLLKNEPDLSYRCRVSIAYNIASGMKRIHDKHYIHRDIRPDNIFITNNYVAKIGDMGISRLQDKFQNHSVLGPNAYMPKEFHTGNYNEKVDVYTFGLTIYHLITGQMHSFENNTVVLNKEPIIFGKLINNCVETLPSNRPTASMIESNLERHYEVLSEVVSKCKGYFLLPKAERTDLCIKTCNIVSELLYN
ncbi:dual specificity mitogen-activated protein kinase kinase dSOR1 [Hydra vulgaris]|uniref:dual specificity mitogen-activated protein kinase kinase dSOR1 n=1 Tax=Hydra vulgaris TaxID=6087 RepID=UPI0032EA3214